MAFFLSLITKLWETLLVRRPFIVYAATWITFVTVTVAVAALAPEVAFVWALTSAPFAHECGGAAVRLPLDALPSEIICIPTELFSHVAVDFLVPPIFAAFIIPGAAFIVRVIGLWEGEDDDSS